VGGVVVEEMAIGVDTVILRSAPLIFILTEMGVAFRRGLKIYSPEMIFAGLGTVVLRSFLFLFSLPWLLFSYKFILARYSILHFSSHSIVAWPLALVVFTFSDYWMHRLQHRWKFLWCFHAVHHQGEDYNAFLAFRDSAFLDFINWPVVLSLALMGIPLAVTATLTGVIGAYALFLHTPLVDSLIFGGVITQPSDHKIHHGLNPQYLGKNYATFFIFWDRLFGTYALEDEAPLFGTVPPVRTHNPFLANLVPWLEWSGFRSSREVIASPSVSTSRAKMQGLIQISFVFLWFFQPLPFKDFVSPFLYWGVFVWAALSLASAILIFSDSRRAWLIGALSTLLAVFLLTQLPLKWTSSLTLLSLFGSTANFASCTLKHGLLPYLRHTFFRRERSHAQ
jgi:sterol desaturase/sphingolipid hydroxylase (fatty acid hydroxylase superfamily)